MKVAVVTFPGSNCDRDLRVAFAHAGAEVVALWHKAPALPADIDLIALSGGFSYGDYLRPGAIAAQSPICRMVYEFAQAGGYVVGICNGFQILCEMQLLPGVLLRNSKMKFVGKRAALRVENTQSDFTALYSKGEAVDFPIAHHDGNYFAHPDTIAELEDAGQVAFRYLDNPNGSRNDIAGIFSANHRILGMMPHPERAIDALLGGEDGLRLFRSIVHKIGQA